MPEMNPYEAPKVRVDDVAPQDAPKELATRGQRLYAAILDGLCFGLVGGGLGIASDAKSAVGMALGAAALIVLGVFNLVLLHRHGQTIGKQSRKIRIVRMNGERASLVRLVFLRGVPQWLISAVPIVKYLSIVDVLFIFGESRRCVHDYIADTKVEQV